MQPNQSQEEYIKDITKESMEHILSVLAKEEAKQTHVKVTQVDHYFVILMEPGVLLELLHTEQNVAKDSLEFMPKSLTFFRGLKVILTVG